MIPFNQPSIEGAEFEYMRLAIEAQHISGDGQFTKKVQALLAELLAVPRVLLTTSCTSALEMSAILAEITPGDEVIAPAFTFVTSVNSFVLRGARPILIDIRPDTLNIDESLIEEAITERTKAIVVVHYAGVGCEMDTIMAIAKSYGILVVEDNAHGLLAKYKGKLLGTFGAMATLSFHETKNFSCGEGGAILLNDERFIERAEIIREKGTDRSRFFRGQVDKYTWVDIGSSYVPSDLLAAYLLAQLEAREAIQHKRQTVWERYAGALQSWANEIDVQLPFVPEYCAQSYHMFYMIMPSHESRTDFIAYLKAHGAMAVFHYVPLNTSPMGQKLGAMPGQCPVTEDVSDRLVRLPFFNNLTTADQDYLIDVICRFRPA